MEVSNLPESELKTMVIKMFNELMGRMDEYNENLNSIKEDVETIKKTDRNKEYDNGNEEYAKRM